MELISSTIEEAWWKILYRILHSGQLVNIPEYGTTLELEEPLMVTIKKPLEARICTKSSWNSEAALEEYYAQCRDPKNTYGFDYTYGSRVFDYFGIDQHSECLKTFDDDINTRRAVLTTWMPQKDYSIGTQPCQILQDRKVRNGKLNITTYFRSHDAFAWPENLFMLSRFLEDDAKELSVEPGRLHVISNAPHIYKNDLKEACEVIGDMKLYNEIMEMF